jgi:glutamate--cysteine ligase
VARGRDPELELLDGDKQRNLVEWGLSLMAEIQPVAEMLDQANSTDQYSGTAAVMKARLQDSSLTPAAQLIAEMTANNETYYGMAMRKAQEHREYFQSKKLTPETTEKYRRLAEESQVKQEHIEASDSLSFDEFIAGYYQ